jgi:Uma2 family endonuclease
MSVASTRPKPPAERLLTAADLAALPEELPSGPVLYELDNGRLVTMAPPGDTHGSVELKIAAQLLFQGEYRGLGKARSGEVGLVLWRNPDRVVGVDALFVSNARLPIARSPEGYLETIPDLVAEVLGKNGTLAGIADKVRDYLAAGVRVVWVADPRTATVTEYRLGQAVRAFGRGGELTVEDVIPGFCVRVDDLFAE